MLTSRSPARRRREKESQEDEYESGRLERNAAVWKDLCFSAENAMKEVEPGEEG